MPTPITPSPEPPDERSRREPSHHPRPTINTSPFNDYNILQPPPTLSTIKPPFTPFFTIITDNNTNATYHPRSVHYIFSDDDPSFLTSACLDTMSSRDQTSGFHNPQHQRTISLNSSSATSHSRSPSNSATGAGQKKVGRPGQAVELDKEERILLLDLDVTGQNVTRAQSLSSSWQILSTTLHPAPTWADSPSDLDAGKGADANPSPNLPSLMLKISGTDGTYIANAETLKKGKGHGLALGSGEMGGRGKGRERDKDKGSEMTEGGLRDLFREFEERMRVLRRVVEAGDEGTALSDEKAG